VKDMSCCGGKSSINNCGKSVSTISIPQKAIASPVVCGLPCVNEYSTSMARFQNQIISNVLNALSRRCEALTPQTTPLPPGALVILNDTTTFDQQLNPVVMLNIQAMAIYSVEVTLQNVRFEIVGFSSAIVRVSGEINITITYQGIDTVTHTQTAIVPFVFTETVAGDFPTNAVVQGGLTINNKLVVNEFDPSTLAIAGVNIVLFFADNIRILAPVA
jgi:hypothetical protein